MLLQALLLIILFLVAVIFAASLSSWRERKRFFQIYNQTKPSAQAKPLSLNYGFGQASAMSEYDFYLQFTKDAKNSQGLVIASLFLHPWILLNEPGYIKQLATASHKKVNKAPMTYDIMAALFGRNLVTNLDYNSWKKQRTTINPMFSHQNMHNLFPTMEHQILNMIEAWRSKDKIEFTEEVSSLTLNVIAACAFGIRSDIREESEALKQVTSNWMNVVSDIATFFGGCFFHMMFSSLPIPSNIRLYRSSKAIYDVAKFLIKKRRQEMKESQGEEDCNKDMLSSLLNARYEDGSSIPDQLIMDEIAIFLLAGHETSSSLLSFAFYFIAKYPQMQERLYKEIEQAGEISHEAISQYKYMEQVLNETLRYYPPIIAVDKTFLEDGVLVNETTGDAHHIAKGTIISFNIAGLHHNEKIWKNSYEFDPERFAPENLKKMEQEGIDIHHAFIPFSSGSRNCIGKFFSLFEVKLIVAHILKNFKVEFYDGKEPDLDVQFGISIKPKTLYLEFKPRN